MLWEISLQKNKAVKPQTMVDSQLYKTLILVFIPAWHKPTMWSYVSKTVTSRVRFLFFRALQSLQLSSGEIMLQKLILQGKNGQYFYGVKDKHECYSTQPRSGWCPQLCMDVKVKDSIKH